MKPQKLIKLLDDAIEKDQGKRYREELFKLMNSVHDADKERAEKPFHQYIGAAVAGKNCARAIWYSFRWCKPKETFDARMLRLFNRGHVEELRVIANFRAADLIYYDVKEDGQQYGFAACEGHLKGLLDGVLHEIPDFPNYPVSIEIKTHNDKSFKNVASKKVREAKPEHYVQLQLGIGAYGFAGGLYIAVNKNDDSLYYEFVPYNQDAYLQALQRINTIVHMPSPPPKHLSDFECKYCYFGDTCAQTCRVVINCRTCTYLNPYKDASWQCSLTGCMRQFDEQLHACSNYKKNPCL